MNYMKERLKSKLHNNKQTVYCDSADFERSYYCTHLIFFFFTFLEEALLYSIMSLQFDFFHYLYHLIPFFSLLAPESTSSTMFRRSRESRYACLVPGFSGVASGSSPFTMMLAVGFSYVGFM